MAGMGEGSKKRIVDPNSSLQLDVEGINFVNLFVVVWKRKWMIAAIAFVFAVGSLVLGFLTPPTYTSTTTLMPITADQNSTISQYASLAAMAGINLPAIGGTSAPSQKIIAILKSRTLCEQVIRDLDLVPRILKNPEGIKNRDPFNVATERMQKTILSVVYDDKSGIIKLEVEFGDPQYAQRIAISATSILGKILNSKSFTISRKTTLELEKQIAAQEKKVSDLQIRMAAFQKDTKIISPEGQVTSAMALYASLLQQRISLQVQLSRLENALSADNTQITTLRSQLDAINKQIRNIESKTGVGSFSFGSAPEQIVEYENIARDLEIATKIYSTLLATYESQKLSEAQDQLYVEVVDPPLVPELKSAPKKLTILAIGTMAGILVGLFVAFVANAIPGMRSQIKEKLEES